jgi:hypothetical protein
MMPDRMAQVREQLRPLASTPVNRDFEPIAYYFDIVLWSTQFKLGYSRWFRAAAHIGFHALSSPRSLFIVVCGGSSGVCGRSRETRPLCRSLLAWLRPASP